MSKIRPVLSLLAVVIFFTVSAFTPADRTPQQDTASLLTGHGEFIQNVGQFTRGEFLLRGTTADFWISPGELRISQTHVTTLENGEMRSRRETFLLKFDGANPGAELQPFGPLDTVLSYMIGSDPEGWQIDVPLWSGLRVLNLYDGIDLIIYGENAAGGLDWELEATPGADLNAVQLTSSSVPVSVAGASEIRLIGNLGTYSLNLPVEVSDGESVPRTVLSTPFNDESGLDTQSTSGGELQTFRAVNYMSFIGGAGQDKAYSVAAEDGFAYITGFTDSIDFPLTAGVVDTTLEGSDAFVAKVNSDGQSLMYATFLGGEMTDVANDIAVEDGIAYIAGRTDSTSFPGLSPWEDQDEEGFVVSLNENGTGIRYARRFGGTAPDEVFGIAVEAGFAYLTGVTRSAEINGVETILKGDIFVGKLNITGDQQYLTVHGGNSLDAAYEITVSGGSAYLVGQSDSKTFAGFFPAGYEAMVIKINAVGGLEWKQVLNSPGTDRANGIALDSSGNIYASGNTDSALFLTELPQNMPYGGGDDGFLVRLTPAGTPNYRTFLGGADHDRAYALAVDSLGGVQVTGETYSSDFPVTADAFDATLSGSSDAFVARVLPGEAVPLDFSSFIGGSGVDYGRGLALDIQDSTFICGETTSSDLLLSTSPFDSTFAGFGEGFAGKIIIGPVPGIVLKKYTNGTDADLPPGPYIKVNDPVTWRYEIFNTGGTSLDSINLTDNLLGTITCESNTLAPGASMTCTASGSAVEGQYENLGTVVAQPQGGLPTVTDEDYSHYFGADPKITITATTAGLDGRVILVGQTAAITYLVKNTGNVPLGSVSVTDTAGIPVSCPQPTLTPNEEITCTSSMLVTAGLVSHTATVNANPPTGLLGVSASDATSHFGASPAIVLTNNVSVDGGTTWNNSNISPGPNLLIGNTPKFQLSVYNSGNVTLTNLSIAGCPTISSLAVGATSSPCVLTGTWESGIRQNQKSATVSFTDGLGNVLPLDSSDNAYYFGANPVLTIQKEISLNGGTTWLDTSAGNAPTLLSGTNPQYRITAKNTGNVALITTISDPALNFGTGCQPTTLEPAGGSDTLICTAQKNWTAGLQTNTAHATASFSDNGGHTLNLDVVDLAQYFGAAPVITFEKFVSVDGGTVWLEADDVVGPSLLSGHAAPQYKVTITNSGNIALTGISVSDNVLSLSGCTTQFDLAVSASKNCTAMAEWSVGSHANTASLDAAFTDSAGHTVAFDRTDTAHYFGASPSLTVSHLVSMDGGASWVEADTATGPTLLQGHSPMYKIIVQNTGNIPLDVSVTGNPIVLPAECDPGILNGGASHQCIISGTWGLGQQSNNAQTSAEYSDTAGNQIIVGANNDAFYFGAQPMLDLEKYVSGDNGTTWNDADTQPGPYFLNTASLKYRLVLDNTGNVTLSGLTWNDPAFSLTGCTLPSTLTPETAPVECILTGTWTPGQVDNLATAGGSYTDSGGHSASPSDTDAAHYFGAQPGVSIVKSTNGDDADAVPGPYILVGGTVIWTYTITNTGNVPLTGIAVSDDNGTPLNAADDFTASCSETELAIGAQGTCSASGPAVEGQYGNTGTVSTQPKVGTVPIGLALSASDVSHYFGAGISMTLEKITNNSTDDNIPPGPFIAVGDQVNWNYKLTNTSNIAIGPVDIWDDNGTPLNLQDDWQVCQVNNIAPGNSKSCTANDLAKAGQYANLGSAVMTMFDKEFTAYDMGHYYGYDPANLLILTVLINGQIPTLPPGIYLPAGESVNFNYTIFNSSPALPISNISLKDISDNVTISCLATELAPLTGTTCSRTISALAGGHTHNAQVTGLISGTQEVSGNTASSYFGTTSGITLDVHTNGSDPASPMDLPIKAGSTVAWEYFVQNTSNIPLTGISIIQIPEVSVTCPKAGLAIGESMICFASGTAQSGANTNQVTVKGVWPDDLQAFYDYEDSYYFGVVAGVDLEVQINGSPSGTPPGPEVPEGHPAIFAAELTNTGNYLLADIVVRIDGAAISCPTSLAADAVVICTAQETASLGAHTRVITVDGTVNAEAIHNEVTAYYLGVEDQYFVFLPLILR